MDHKTKWKSSPFLNLLNLLEHFHQNVFTRTRKHFEGKITLNVIPEGMIFRQVCLAGKCLFERSIGNAPAHDLAVQFIVQPENYVMAGFRKIVADHVNRTL